MILIFEGMDRSGKTSIREGIRKTRNHEDVTLDRFFGSMIVYGKVFNKYPPEKYDEWNSLEQKFEDNFSPVLIYMYADLETIKARLRETGHENIDDETLHKTLKEYDEYFENCKYSRKIAVDSGKNDIDTCVSIINDFLENI